MIPLPGKDSTGGKRKKLLKFYSQKKMEQVFVFNSRFIDS
jgi:isopentenyl phosphate kinase